MLNGAFKPQNIAKYYDNMYFASTITTHDPKIWD